MNKNPLRLGGRALVLGVLIMAGLVMGWLFWARGRAMSQPVPGVVLLPFQTQQPEFAYFADGLTIELINSLSKVEKLRVLSWNSAKRFRGKASGLKQLREELKAGAMLDGTIRKQGDRLVVTAKLIDTNGGETIWSDTYNRPEGEIFKIEEEIAKSIVYSLKVPLRVDPQRILVPVRTQSLAAYHDYLRARAALGTFSPENLAQSSLFAEKAVAEEPKFAPAYALLAANYAMYGGVYGPLTSEALAKAMEFARKTNELDLSSGEAHSALGLALGIGEWDWKGAKMELERAIQWSPGSPDAHAAIALGYLLPSGDLEGAEYEARKALELDPLSYFGAGILQDVLQARGQGTGGFGPIHEARAKASAGDVNSALLILESLVNRHDPGVIFLQSDVKFASLRKDPRYAALLKRVKLS